MDSSERSNKRALPWSKGQAFVLQLAVCFVFGAVAPLATTGGGLQIDGIRASFLPCRHDVQPVALAPPPAAPDIGLLLIVTVTRPDDDGASPQEAALTRLGHTLRLVAPPLLWIVVGPENRTASAAAVQALRGTGVMFRHLAYAAAENATTGDQADGQRNVALGHIERHRLGGVIHFAAPSSVYDLRFFQELRQTRGFAAWPTATVSATYRRVTVQGPTCNSSQITGWYSKDSGDNATAVDAQDTGAIHNSSSSPPEINISGLAFRSSILWDSETLTNSSGSQDFIQLVRKLAVGDGDKRIDIPSDCSESRIMVWHLDMPTYTPEVEERKTHQEQILENRDEEDYLT